MNSPFWHSRVLWFRGISDNPNPAMKRLMISLLALEGKGLYSFPLHEKAKVYQDRKNPQANFLPFEVRKPKLSCSNHVQTYVHRPQHTAAKIKLWRLLFIFSAGFRLSHETSSQRISCLVKIRDSFGFSF